MYLVEFKHAIFLESFRFPKYYISWASKFKRRKQKNIPAFPTSKKSLNYSKLLFIFKPPPPWPSSASTTPFRLTFFSDLYEDFKAGIAPAAGTGESTLPNNGFMLSYFQVRKGVTSVSMFFEGN